MIYTLSQAREVVKRFVDSGSCVNAVIDARINEALDRLIASEDWECMKKIVRINVYDKVFALPWNVGKLMYVSLDGTPGKVMGTAYQFLSSGPGDLDYRSASSGFKDVADKGDNWPTMYDMPKATSMKVVAVSTGTNTENLRLKGFDDNGYEIDEEIPIQTWTGSPTYAMSGVFGDQIQLSEASFKEITRVWKPDTNDYVSVFGVDPDTNAMQFLATYHPSQNVPGFRRYMITNTSAETQTSVLALVKLRHVPLVHADDIVPIPSLQALKLMIMAIRHENSADLQNAVTLEAQARRLMEDKEKDRIMSDGTPVIMNHDYRTSLGRHLNRGIIL